jgi:hypothetical protein
MTKMKNPDPMFVRFLNDTKQELSKDREKSPLTNIFRGSELGLMNTINGFENNFDVFILGIKITTGPLLLLVDYSSRVISESIYLIYRNKNNIRRRIEVSAVTGALLTASAFASSMTLNVYSHHGKKFEKNGLKLASGLASGVYHKTTSLKTMTIKLSKIGINKGLTAVVKTKDVIFSFVDVVSYFGSGTTNKVIHFFSTSSNKRIVTVLVVAPITSITTITSIVYIFGGNETKEIIWGHIPDAIKNLPKNLKNIGMGVGVVGMLYLATSIMSTGSPLGVTVTRTNNNYYSTSERTKKKRRTN